MIAPAKHRPREERRQLGQYFTPAPVAAFLASLFSENIMTSERVRVLDAGAGSGRLTEALVERLLASPRPPRAIGITAWEIDPAVLPELQATLTRCRAQCAARGVAFDAEVRSENFVVAAAANTTPGLFAEAALQYDLAIVNPPYRKLAAGSPENAALRELGIESPNLYTAFLSLITRLLRPGGELAAITPRSFCNGAYFQKFRRDFLASMRVTRLHLTGSRTKTFSEDAVLQETLLVHAVRDDNAPETVTLSHSDGAPTGREPASPVDWRQIVRPDDPCLFIHLPGDGDDEADAMAALPHTLADLGLEVSTGKVVPFRSRDWIHASPEADDAPLLWASHLDGAGGVRWPLGKPNRPEALARCAATSPWIAPAGHYVAVKRLTAKEERRRVVASVVNTTALGPAGVAFENHLNYFHARGRGLTPELARALCDYLNSDFVDRWFRLFNGHTQVNATDLRALRFPDFALRPAADATPDEPDFILNETPDTHA